MCVSCPEGGSVGIAALSVCFSVSRRAKKAATCRARRAPAKSIEFTSSFHSPSLTALPSAFAVASPTPSGAAKADPAPDGGSWQLLAAACWDLRQLLQNSACSQWICLAPGRSLYGNPAIPPYYQLQISCTLVVLLS